MFRAELVGALTKTELAHGDLAAELTALSRKRYHPPGSHGPRSYAVSTLQRWLYDYKAGGVDALRPKPRSDKGRGRDLPPELRELLLDIRGEHPRASIPVILSTLQADGRLAAGLVSESTVRRLFVQEGLDRVSLPSDAQQGKVRLRWAAERPGALWHGDVCNVRLLDAEKGAQSVRIHALLDDASRYIVAIEARHAECSSPCRSTHQTNNILARWFRDPLRSARIFKPLSSARSVHHLGPCPSSVTSPRGFDGSTSPPEDRRGGSTGASSCGSKGSS